MSRPRQHQSKLADAKLFLLFRWFTWLLAVGLVIWQGIAPTYFVPLLLAGAVNLLATLFSQAYMRFALRLPALLSLDVVFCVVLLFTTGSWAGPLALYALSGIVLPALLYGWRGGVMAGLLMVSLHLALYLANGVTPAEMIANSSQAELLTLMVIPPLFGCFFPSAIDMVRRGIEQREEARRTRERWSFDEPRLDRVAKLDTIDRPSSRGREQDHRPTPIAEFQPARATIVRTAEPRVEELRRVLCAPLGTSDADLQATINTLAARYGSHSGVHVRVTVLGRARTVAYAQHAVLVRLLQESLLNVQQHAHAGKVELTLRYDALSVALLVQDNGVGLLDGTHERSGLHALRAMHYRLAELGGRLDVFETEGGGVTVRATAPLE